MRKALAVLAVTAAAAIMAVTASATTGHVPIGSSVTVSASSGPQRNFDNGGGQVPIGSYIARVYIYYDGYYHWLNCQWIVYPWGAFMDHCW